MMRCLVAALTVVVACTVNEPSLDTWVQEQWRPMVELVPEPDAATAARCRDALGEIRERAANLDPAPFVELREAAQAWVRGAESLMFSCASGATSEYTAGHENLLLRKAEVDALLARS